MIWEIELTESAIDLLKSIRDARIRSSLMERIEKLSEDPDKQGKPLKAELAGYRSVRAVGQRYRILYQLTGSRVVVVVVAIGIRKDSDKRDVYALARKLVRAGLLGEGDK
ncbi:MAG: mRNA interferase RelE/StbE [Desulfovibrionales bacterium]|nr:mRNA interferase RelE/StbE [Desulfovibrionales bacterium]